MTSVVKYYPNTIVTKSRGLLEYLTFGNWGRICTLDFSRGTLEEQIIRPLKTTVQSWKLDQFDAVDYSYRLLQSTRRKGMEHELDEFSVGLRFSTTGKVLPLAVFHGSTSTPAPEGFDALLFAVFPALWAEGTGGTHDVQSRSFANMLCQKMHLKLAM